MPTSTLAGKLPMLDVATLLISRLWRMRSVPTFAAAHSPFKRGIADVVFVGAQKQMCRIDACRIVAFMTNKHSGRDRSMSQFPSNTMRFPRLVPDSKCAVPIMKPSAQPLYAAVWQTWSAQLLEPFAESSGASFALILHLACIGAKRARFRNATKRKPSTADGASRATRPSARLVMRIMARFRAVLATVRRPRRKHGLLAVKAQRHSNNYTVAGGAAQWYTESGGSVA
jgi:hypothetical protein